MAGATCRPKATDQGSSWRSTRPRSSFPDRPGNKRLDSLLNILANPHVGLLFLIPGMDETLRVNGTAEIVQDDDLLERLAVDGKRPLLAIVVHVQETFLHCARSFCVRGCGIPITSCRATRCLPWGA